MSIVLALRCLLLLCLVSGAGLLRADSPNLLHYRHENLRTGQQHDLESMQGRVSLLMFFEPGCSWCFKQTRAFNELLEQCPKQLAMAALGVHGNRRELKKALWHLQASFPGLMASPQMLKDMQGVPATPMTLVADEHGVLLSYLRGYIPVDKLQSMLAGSYGIRCDGEQHGRDELVEQTLPSAG